jgi:hypothetical protein
MNSNHIYQDRTPYFYLILHKPSGKKYAGAKWAKGCHPSQFFSNYFTSSKVVKALIEQDGIESFEVLEIKTVDDIDLSCIPSYETRWLNDHQCAQSKEWLNQANNSYKNIHWTKHKTPEEIAEIKRKISESRKGKPGTRHTEEHKEKMRKLMTNRVISDSHRQNMSNAWRTRPPHTEESNRKRSAALQGRTFSDTHRKRLGVASAKRRGTVKVYDLHEKKNSYVFPEEVEKNQSRFERGWRRKL